MHILLISLRIVYWCGCIVSLCSNVFDNQMPAEPTVDNVCGTIICLALIKPCVCTIEQRLIGANEANYTCDLRDVSVSANTIDCSTPARI